MSTISSLGISKSIFSKISEQSSKIFQEIPIGISSKSSEVKLSQDAKALANFAQKGISASLREMNHPLSSKIGNQSSESAVGLKAYEKNISMDNLNRILLNLGASDNEVEQLKLGLDSNKNGTISHDELMQGVAATIDNGRSISQTILSIMDRSGDSNGTVNANEFAQFTTALIDTENS